MRARTRRAIFFLMMDGKVRCPSEIRKELGLSRDAVRHAVKAMWGKGLLLRSSRLVYQFSCQVKGRAGVVKNTRGFHLYVLAPEGSTFLQKGGVDFVGYDVRYVDKRGRREGSTASKILKFLLKYRDKAFFSTHVAKALGIKPRDVMTNVRRFEKKGLVYVRGAKNHFANSETYFKEGYVITAIDRRSPDWDKALDEAVARANKLLNDVRSSNPVVDRVRRIREMVLEATKLGELVNIDQIREKLGCTENELMYAMNKLLNYYRDIMQLRIFHNFLYYYHTSMSQEELRMAIDTQKEVLRKTKGRDARIGHNWEACVEWFIDTFTTAASFWSQQHRKKMDQRRITIHLMKGVNGRKNNAEVDRVWETTNGLIPPITTIHVLECKWGLIKKRHIDDLVEVLRWSKEFGANSTKGRVIKGDVQAIFAGSFFDPRETVQLDDGTKKPLTSYVNDLRIKLLRPSDFAMLRKHGVEKWVTVQKICKYSKNEEEVRGLLRKIWEEPGKARKSVDEAIVGNRDLYDFERLLEEKAAVTVSQQQVEAREAESKSSPLTQGLS